MAQFLAYVYPEKTGYRVYVEGLGEATVATLGEAGRAAFDIVARSIYGSYPDRTFPSRRGTAEQIALEIRIVRVPPRRDGPVQGPPLSGREPRD